MDNKKNIEGMTKEEEVLFVRGQELVNKINPEPVLLKIILDKTEIKSVTNTQDIRNTRVDEGEYGRTSIINKFINITNTMNKYLKTLAGGAVVSVIIITIIFISKGSDKIEIPVVVKNNNQEVGVKVDQNNVKVPVTNVEVGGVAVDVDSLVADLMAVDSAFEEPIIDDSDLSASLINTNNYEI